MNRRSTQVPSCTINSPPAPPSSAGWKISRTLPVSSASCSFSSLAAPSSCVTCASCPQACILPGVLLLQSDIPAVIIAQGMLG